MKSLKKSMYVMSLIVVLAVLFSSCQGGVTTASQTGATTGTTTGATTKATTAVPTTTGTTEPVVITTLISVSQVPPDENAVQKAIGEALGIIFQPTHVVNTEYETKFNTMAAAGSLPDIIKFSGYNRTMDMIKNNIVIDLTDLLNEYGADILENRGDALFDCYANVDGKLYGLTGVAHHIPVLAIRQDWLNNLGLQVPDTTDEYFDVLHAFTYDDPNKSDKNDTIGLGITAAFTPTFSHLFGAFGVPFNSTDYVDGKLLPYIMIPGYLDAIKYIRTIYQDGTMEPDFVTIPNMSCLEKLWGGIYGAYDGNPAGTTNNWIGRFTEDPKPEFVYTIIRGPTGKGGAPMPQAGNGYTGINSKCKNPDKAMQVINYICSEEGNMLAFAGIEGTHFAWNADGKTFQYIGKYANDQALHRDEGGFAYVALSVRKFDAQYMTMNEFSRKANEMGLENSIRNAVSWRTPNIDLTFDQMAMTCSLIVYEGDVDAEYSRYIKEYLDQGGDKWIEETTKLYKEEQGIN